MKGGLETNSENRFKTHLLTIRRFRINGLSRGGLTIMGVKSWRKEICQTYIYISDDTLFLFSNTVSILQNLGYSYYLFKTASLYAKKARKARGSHSAAVYIVYIAKFKKLWRQQLRDIPVSRVQRAKNKQGIHCACSVNYPFSNNCLPFNAGFVGTFDC